MNRPRRTLFLVFLAPAIAGVMAACGAGNNFTQDATTENATVTASVYAFTGSAPELLAAYNASTNTFVRPIIGQYTGAANFELAFDIRDDGKLLLLPVRALIPFAPAPAGGAAHIGLQKSGTSFDLIERAPSNGYTLDSTVVASAGETYLFKLTSAGCFYGEPYYGKLVLDSVIVSQRRIVVRALTNLNCGGYRSLTTGLPKD